MTMLKMRTRIAAELRKKLETYPFTHFITLATNHRIVAEQVMRQRLRSWDARVNRSLNGPDWSKKPDERLLWFAFLEKGDVNPHWHLLAQVDPMAVSPTRAARISRLPVIAEKSWMGLSNGGTVNCQAIASNRVINYVTKCLHIGRSIESFVISTEFQTRA